MFIRSASAPTPATHTALALETWLSGDTVTVRLRGEVDLSTTAALTQALRDAECLQARHVVLDLHGLAFIDVMGMHALLDAQQRAEENDHSFALADVPPFATRLFALAGVGDQLVHA